jgi:hypothetical protein
VKAGVLLVAVIALSGCVTSRPRLVNQEDAQVQFARLGPGEKRLASEFYDLGAGDAVKRLYWAQRRAQETGGTADAQPTVLQRKYVNIPSPPYRDVDGVLREGSIHAVEVVQFWTLKLKNGKRFNLCY